MIELKGNFNDDAFSYAFKFLTLEHQIKNHMGLFNKEHVDPLFLSEKIREFNQLDLLFKERYFSQYKPFTLFPLGPNPSLRVVYYFPFEIITPINCSYILNEIRITG